MSKLLVLQNVLLIYSYFILSTIVPSFSRFISECNQIDNYQYAIIQNEKPPLFKYVIDIQLFCRLDGRVNDIYLSELTRKSILEIMGNDTKDCFGKNFTLVDVRRQWNIDTRLDFPYHHLIESDRLRARVLSCIDIERTEIGDKDECDRARVYNKEIIRNTIDHYAGFTRANMRATKFQLEKCERIDHGYFKNKFRDCRTCYLSAVNIKYAKEDSSGRNLQNIDYSNLAVNTQTSISSASTAVSTTSSSITGLQKYTATISTLSLLSSLSGLISSNVKNSKAHQDEVESRLLNIERDGLETRRLYLRQMENMIKEQKMTNEWLRVISGQLGEVIDILIDIREELEEINDKLNDIDDKMKEITGRNKTNVEIEDLPLPDIPNDAKKIAVGKIPNPIIDKYDSLLNDYKSLRCDSFTDLRNIYLDVTFMIFYLKMANREFSQEEYRIYRFDSAMNMRIGYKITDLYYIGGRHPEFSMRTYALNEDMKDWSMDKSEEEIIEVKKNSLVLFEVLANTIRNQFQIDHLRHMFNDLYMSGSRADSSVYKDIIYYLNLENICNLY